MAVEFQFAVRSDVGLVRKNNQDSAYAGSRLLVVADGMGGPAGGDIASSVVVAQLAPLDDAPGPADSLVTNLSDALQNAHDELVERSVNDPSLRGLGTTCTALLRSENKLAMVHIGDSRAYLLRDGNLVQVTADHSLVQYLVDTGRITKEEAEHHPKRNVIMNTLGDAPGPVQADATVREAVLGDRWLLCSDGLSGVVSDDTIGHVMRTYADLDACADELVTLALLGGGPDNISVVLADVVPAGTTKSQVPRIVGAAAVERNRPSKGSMGAAGRAAALVLSDEVNTEDPDDLDFEAEQTRRKRRRSFWGWMTFTVVILAVVGGLLFYGWKWNESQFYVQGRDGKVVVYQGIPQSIGAWRFSRPIEVTDLVLSDLAPVDRTRLEDPVIRSSLDEIDRYLDEVRSRIRQPAGHLDNFVDNPQSGVQSESQSGGG